MQRSRDEAELGKEFRISISEIRDQENNLIPRSALSSIVKRISEAMTDLGVRARIEAREEYPADRREGDQPPLLQQDCDRKQSRWICAPNT